MESGRDAPPSVWLVDGFNVLHAGLLSGTERKRWWAARERRRLVERAAQFEDAAAEIWVVFDGPHPAAEEPADGESPTRVHVVFAPNADDWLLERLRSAREGELVAVVTRDRRLAARSRQRGVRVVGPREFLSRCASSDAPSPGE